MAMGGGNMFKGKCTIWNWSNFFVKVVSRFKWIWILPSVFLMEMFDLRGKELKHAKELLLNHCRKSVQNSMRLQDMWVELKL